MQKYNKTYSEHYARLTLIESYDPKMHALIVTDKPDYYYRQGMSFSRGLGRWAEGESDPAPAYRAGIDWLLRFKLNALSDYLMGMMRDVRSFTEKERQLLTSMNAYAVERGIYPASLHENEPFPSISSLSPDGR